MRAAQQLCRLALSALTALAAATATLVSISAQAGMVNFDSPEALDLSDLSRVRYTEGAYTLSYDATDGSAVALQDLGSGGSGALVLLAGSQLTLSRTDGGLIGLNDLVFGLSPLDASGASLPLLQVFGLLGGVTQVSADLDLGAGLGFQAFGGQWTGLSTLRFASSGDAVLDDIRLTDLQAVPEPGSAALLLAALLAASLVRRQAVKGQASSGLAGKGRAAKGRGGVPQAATATVR